MQNLSYDSVINYSLPNFTQASRAHSYILNDGITVTAQSALSENSLFDVNYFSIPYNVSGSWVTVNYLMFRMVNPGSVPGCRAFYSTAPQQLAETFVYNFFSSQNYSTNGFMCESYNVASSA